MESTIIYLRLVTADREVATFALSAPGAIRDKGIRYLTAMAPLWVMAALPIVAGIRGRSGPVLLLATCALALSCVYVVVDLTQLEYKFVLAAMICLAPLAAAVVDPLVRRRPRLGMVTVAAVAAALAAINLVLVFGAGAHVPGNLAAAAPLDESSFWLALRPSDTDADWTTAIRESTPEDTVVVARVPGMQLSAIVGRAMYVPSDTDGGFVPGYNLDQRFYLLRQRGYSADLYEKRLDVVETLYTSHDEAAISGALSTLKQLRRPVAIHFSSRDIYSRQWLETQAIGESLFSDGRNIVWFIADPGVLP